MGLDWKKKQASSRLHSVGVLQPCRTPWNLCEVGVTQNLLQVVGVPGTWTHTPMLELFWATKCRSLSPQAQET